jgi:hypothetical protein
LPLYFKAEKNFGKNAQKRDAIFARLRSKNKKYQKTIIFFKKGIDNSRSL